MSETISEQHGTHKNGELIEAWCALLSAAHKAQTFARQLCPFYVQVKVSRDLVRSDVATKVTLIKDYDVVRNLANYSQEWVVPLGSQRGNYMYLRNRNQYGYYGALRTESEFYILLQQAIRRHYRIHDCYVVQKWRGTRGQAAP